MKFQFNFDSKPRPTYSRPAMGKKGTWLALGITLIFMIVSEYFSMVPITLKSPTSIIYLMFLLGIFVGLNILFTQKNPKRQ